VSHLPSFIEDTPDLLRALEELKKEQIPDSAIPVTIDVVGLYSNIPQDEALKRMEEALEARPACQKQQVPTNFLMTLLNLVLSLNIFTFNGNLYKQLWGVAMGTRCAPTVANIFMGAIEKKILDSSTHSSLIFKGFWRRFIDDIILIWTGTEEELTDFIQFINSIHPTIKFTANYSFQTRSVPFLDTTITIKGGAISTDLYRKPTHSPQYLLPSSTHPPHCVKNIPYSLAYRIRRICSEEAAFEVRLQELKEMLVLRDYKPNIIDEAISRVKKIPRQEAIQKVIYSQPSCEKVNFAIHFDPRLPKISSIVNKHFGLMKQDSLCAKIFEKGVQIAYKRHKNIRDILCRATVPPLKTRNTNRKEKGWKTCSQLICKTCDYSENKTEFMVTATGETIKINQKITCTDKNVIYCIHCQKCGMQYVGKTTQKFKTRVTQHQNSVRTADRGKNSTDKEKKDIKIGPVAEHFNQKSHTMADMLFFAFEKVQNGDPFIVGARERFYIDKMEVLERGINKNRTNK
jgi:peptide-methionine (R)-S-oxide reductase